MAAAGVAGLLHYGWTRGFAAVVEAPARRTAAVFGPAGWVQGDPSSVLPAGAPPGAEVVRLALTERLADQIAGLQFSIGGLHTEFVRLRSLLGRLCAQGADSVVLVLGERPAVFAVADGEITSAGLDATPPEEARGWIVVFSGKVSLPAAEAPGAADETYFVPSNSRDSLPEEVATAILKVAGPAGERVPGLLDGTRTIGVVAGMAGLSAGQARAAVGVLVAHRLAFRCVSRPKAGSRTKQGSSAQP